MLDFYAMLIKENVFLSSKRVVFIMHDIAILAASVKTTLLEVSNQALALGNGLLNAAPGDNLANPNNSVKYLLHIHETLAKLAEECDQFLTPPSS